MNANETLQAGPLSSKGRKVIFLLKHASLYSYLSKKATHLIFKNL